MKRRCAILYILMIIVFQNAFALHDKAQSKNANAIEFFSKQREKKEEKHQFNPYENVISGVIAFTIGNIGYYYTTSTVQKLIYSLVQTAGLVNLGHGIYKYNTPSTEESFSRFLTKSNKSTFTSNEVAGELLHIFAKEERAKRLSIFYSTSLLSAQYFMNAFIYEVPDKLKTTYMFLGGVNFVAAVYSAFFKGNYERYYYGNQIDLAPFAYTDNINVIPGMMISYSF